MLTNFFSLGSSRMADTLDSFGTRKTNYEQAEKDNSNAAITFLGIDQNRAQTVSLKSYQLYQ
jgi:hypothetical protein